MDSRQTAIARGRWAAAVEDRNRHRLDCGQCEIAAYKRRPALRCVIGVQLAAAATAARMELDQNIAADAEPITGQAELDLGLAVLATRPGDDR